MRALPWSLSFLFSVFLHFKVYFSYFSGLHFIFFVSTYAACISIQVVSKLVQIREYIGKATSMRDDLVEKNDVPANVERLSLLITHLKEQEKSYLRFLQKMLVRIWVLCINLLNNL